MTSAVVGVVLACTHPCKFVFSCPFTSARELPLLAQTHDKMVVVHLLKLNSKAAPGSALIGMSRAISNDVLTFGNEYGYLTTE